MNKFSPSPISQEMSFPHEAGWLGRFVAHAVDNNWCVKIGCTTCGAGDFRKRLIAFASHGSRQLSTGKAAEIKAETVIIDELKMLQRNDLYRDAVILVLSDLRGGAFYYPNLVSQLQGCWAGEILEEMEKHARDRSERRREHDARNDPENVRLNREAKKKAKAEKHSARLAEKAIRDKARRT